MLILIVGSKRSGKTTLSNYLKQRYKGTSLALADPMKEFVCKLFGISLQELERLKTSPNKIIFDLTMRNILQNVGQSFKEVIQNPDIWCELAEKKMVSSQVYILSDVRLVSEARFFTRKYPDFISIKISTDKESKDTHITEREWDNILTDITVHNDFSGEENFCKQVFEQVEKTRILKGISLPETW